MLQATVQCEFVLIYIAESNNNNNKTGKQLVLSSSVLSYISNFIEDETAL